MRETAVERERVRSEPSSSGTPPAPAPERRASNWVKGVAPLALLALVIITFMKWDPASVFRTAFPPIEELTIQRIVLPATGVMQVQVINGGPEPVTVAQVFVDDAAWTHTMDGPRRIERLASRTITIPYPWVEGEPHAVRLVSSTGLTFDGEVAVATQSPRPSFRFLAVFATLGIYVGVIPVFLGLLWLPFLRSVQRKWVDFFLSLTIGLLVFLGVDALAEALEVSARVAGAFQGLSLVLLGVLGTPLTIASIGEWRRRTGQGLSPLYVSALIALAIGLHNLGEGLAIGAAYSTGEISLGAFLVLGFLLHNTTEGLGIVAPLAQERISVRQLVMLGLLAGAPTILGTWLGGFSYSPVAVTLFFAIGAGAIVQVIYELWKLFARRAESGITRPLNAAGVLIGLAVMYVTGLLVTA
ncbi:MAG: ZIP family metal transporter [Longimicrobiales bacterium]